jgi:hypothetical protein
MNGKKEFIFTIGKMVEVVTYKTAMGDYISTANYPWHETYGVCRDNDPKISFTTCIDRLLKVK